MLQFAAMTGVESRAPSSVRGTSGSLRRPVGVVWRDVQLTVNTATFDSP